MNIAATDSYRAVPSILIVAPNGRTKLAVRFEILFLTVTPCRVSGKVAELDAVEKAFNRAAPTPFA